MKKISETSLQKIKIFAIKMKHHHDSQGISSRDNARGDLDDNYKREITGKTGEVAVAEYVSGLVNFTVYEKSSFVEYGHDIMHQKHPDFQGYKIHVKTSHFNSPMAFLIEKNDPVVKKPSKQDLIFFCQANEEGQYNILGYCTGWKIQHFWGNPILKKFRSYKYGVQWNRGNLPIDIICKGIE